MDWSPNPLPELLAPRGPGWSGTGPGEPVTPPPSGISWRPKQQATGTGVSYAEFTAALKIYLTALSAATGVHTGVLTAHLTGLMSARTIGGAEGEFIDNTLKAKLTAWTIATSQVTARAAFTAKGTAESLAAFTAMIQAHLMALSSSQANTTAALLAHLSGISPGIGSASASAQFGAWGPASTSFSTPGAFTYNIPSACLWIETANVGAGGGGSGGNSFLADGRGGEAGVWASRRLVRGVDIPWNLSQITGTVGSPGSGGARGNGTGTAGGATVVNFPDGALTAAGGAPGSGTNPAGQTLYNGKAAGNYQFGGVTYPGGGQVGRDTDGATPGGGGGAGSGGAFGSDKAGRPGGPGRANFKAGQ